MPSSCILRCMAGKQRDKVRSQDITGLKYFQRLLPLFDRLHEVGCQRDKAGNRELFMDEYCVLILLFLFNPVVTSLRALQQASELKKVQRKLGCPRASLGSLSEATQVFDPAPLREIIRSCWDRCSRSVRLVAGNWRTSSSPSMDQSSKHCPRLPRRRT